MKSLNRVAAVVATACVTCVPSFAATFGFHKGETVQQVIAAVGQKNVLKTEKNPGGGINLTLQTTPEPHDEFESYKLYFSPDKGLLRVVAVGKDIPNTPDGAELRNHYFIVHAQIGRNYGAPYEDIDDLDPHSRWKKPNDYVMGMVQGDRSLVAHWGNGSDSMHYPNDISCITLFAGGLDSTTGYVAVDITFIGWDAFSVLPGDYDWMEQKKQWKNHSRSVVRIREMPSKKKTSESGK